MVDVVFVLLLFFMALAGARQMEHRISAAIPTPEPGDGTSLVIDISSSGAVLCNGLELLSPVNPDPAKLNDWLKTLAAADPEATILIRPASDAQHGHFIQVLSSLHAAGLKKITFA
jgi:biopolymer transport protein ExbD